MTTDINGSDVRHKLKVRRYSVLALLFFSLSVTQRTPPASAQALTSKTWGPNFATPGAALELKRIPQSKSTEKAGGTASYFLGASGFDRSTTVDLWLWRVGKEPEVVAPGLNVKNGTLACGQVVPPVKNQTIGCAGPGEQAEITIDSLKGEPVAVGL